MIRQYLKPLALPNAANWAVLILRVGFSFFMVHHGYEKLQNLLTGNSADFPDPLHVGPQLSHGLTVFAEFFCSILLILGLGTRLALVVLMGCMLVIATILSPNEPLSDKEHALLFLIAYVALYLTGPGKYSLDSKLFK
ncbi:MAG: DoxX family protein [Runella slithyformis]|nr:MAG: DoxX family protein [Runella slithyformis]TAF96447.1 MAG: DoxX family protein [Runella sp.]TAG18449.1 MAG: DoxX family protein [Cytophagales bacterium]TAG39744.1 MAG: DoxX family protein [Cytophagia bacterium]TAF23067.1 MAG: DoxX family protein [Runella slithyformis]